MHVTNCYEPLGAARELWQSKGTEILIAGPAGTGKTTAVLEKTLALALKYPGSRHLLLRKTRASLTESVLVTFENKVLPPNSPIALGVHRSHRQAYNFPNGSTIVCGGLDKPEKTFSTEYDTVAVFEAIEATEHDWESLHRSLRNGKMGYHQAIADTNPGPPTHWLNQRANAGKMTRLSSKHEDNPLLWDADNKTWTKAGAQYIARLDSLSGHRRERLRFGRWTSAEGQVYPDFRASVHLVNRFPVPDEWQKLRVIDFGFTHPFVCLWFAMDPEGRMYLYREIFMTQTIVEDHARVINEVSQGEQYVVTLADPENAEGRMVLAKNGIETTKAMKSKAPGIDAVTARLRDAPDGKPRLFLMRDSLVERDPKLVEDKRPYCTEQEFDCYIRPPPKDGQVQREDPLKENDDGMDCVRYAVAYLDNVGSRFDFRIMDGGRTEVERDPRKTKEQPPPVMRPKNDERCWQEMT